MRLTRLRMISMAIAFVAAALAAVVLMLRHEPLFYRRAAMPEGPERFEMSNDFVVKDFVQLVTNFVDGKGAWSHTFTQDQFNSYFEEDFVSLGDADHFRKIGITNPRLEFTDKEIHLGFRFGSGFWSTVFSYDLKVWLAKSEVNVLAIEIERRRAGALPIPSQHVFQELKDLGRRHNIEIEWYRHNGNPVAIVKFQCDRPRPTAQLRRLEIGPGKLSVHGISFDPVQNPLEEPIKKAPVEVSKGS
jgi:hypothetical protein